MKKSDIIKVIAYIRVFNKWAWYYLFNIDCGKGNLHSYFHKKYGWSLSKIKKIVAVLVADGIVKNKPSDVGGCYILLSYIDNSYILRNNFGL